MALRWGQLLAGLAGYSVAIVLMLRSGLGLGPWDAFHVGLHELTGISIGGASIAVGAVIVAGTWTAGFPSGPGTLANMTLIGLFVDLLLPHVSMAPRWTAAIAYYIGAIVISGVATGMYIGAGLGRGPRDGLMIALAERSGWTVRRARTVVELVVLGVGWLMGGKIGVGTVLFALGIGPATHWGLDLFGVLPEAATGRGEDTATEDGRIG